MTEDCKSTIEHFHQVVNMSPHQLSSWLKSEDSQEVGQKNGEDESIGHQSGRQITIVVENENNLNVVLANAGGEKLAPSRAITELHFDKMFDTAR